MRILIAGAAGFIGCHLARRCLQRGHQVIGVDNFCTGDRDNIAWLTEPSPRPAGADFTFVEHDVTRELDLAGPLDLVCDLACPASPVDFGPLALDIMRVCSQGVWNLLELARRRGARFLHTSTSEVYGDPDVHPQVESYWGRVNPIGPRSVYDEGKRYAEALITAYRRKHDLPVRLARIFNTYGPRMRLDDGRVVTNFICQALAGRPLTVYGDGSQTRSFCYVDDQVEGLLRLADCDYAAPVNIGNPDEIPIGELAREIIELTGSSSPLQFKPLPGDDPRVRRPDISLARRVLGWSPAVGRREGLQRTVEFCKAKLSRA